MQQVYNLFDPSKQDRYGRVNAEKTVALTEDQALIAQIQGWRVTNLTELHGITVTQWHKMKDQYLPITEAEQDCMKLRTAINTRIPK